MDLNIILAYFLYILIVLKSTKNILEPFSSMETKKTFMLPRAKKTPVGKKFASSSFSPAQDGLKNQPKIF